ncbi:uncharacterized protein LOC106013203 [Aplysia californica]|uniref:Uncharacterized protein LOC106013203 n=1 Tax=Aplysia californica TaxID=6500 RepID=A0ABM1AA37_APLCA|nr:uncharacterized protein LOC106013203 [Aplysia californica]
MESTTFSLALLALLATTALSGPKSPPATPSPITAKDKAKVDDTVNAVKDVPSSCCSSIVSFSDMAKGVDGAKTKQQKCNVIKTYLNTCKDTGAGCSAGDTLQKARKQTAATCGSPLLHASVLLVSVMVVMTSHWSKKSLMRWTS